MFSTSQVIQAFILTLLAGLATGIGSIIALKAKTTNKVFLAVSLGFSAGVMVYVSFVEIFQQGIEKIVSESNAHTGNIYAVIAFFAGIAIAALIDHLVPEAENPHEFKTDIKDFEASVSKIEASKKDNKLYRVGIMSALALAIHNFPEGIATFVAGLSDPQLGISIAVAVAIHNIPEGIAASVPIYYATNDKKKAFTFSFLSGLAEPVGAIIAYLVLMPFLNATLLGIVFCVVAGIMVFISIDELLPAAHEYGEHHHIIYSFIAGMAIMAISLVLL